MQVIDFGLRVRKVCDTTDERVTCLYVTYNSAILYKFHTVIYLLFAVLKYYGVISPETLYSGYPRGVLIRAMQKFYTLGEATTT